MQMFKPASIAALTLFAIPAYAATYTFDVVVVESIDHPGFGFELPDIGTMGTVSFTLDAAALDADGDPMTGVGMDHPLNPALAGASASIGGLTSSLSSSNTSIFGFSERARFSEGNFANITIQLAGANCVSLGCTLAGDFSVFGPSGSGTPTTYADVDALLNDPLSTVWFRFNGSATGGFVSFKAETVPVPAIPLPASGILLLAALGAGRMLRRRR